VRSENVSSGTRWETVVGYSRVVRVGLFVYVPGMTATDESGGIVGAGDPYTGEAGAGKRRGGVVDIEDCGEVGRAHGEFFGEV
jgi:hypothetical protein